MQSQDKNYLTLMDCFSSFKQFKLKHCFCDTDFPVECLNSSLFPFFSLENYVRLIWYSFDFLNLSYNLKSLHARLYNLDYALHWQILSLLSLSLWDCIGPAFFNFHSLPSFFLIQHKIDFLSFCTKISCNTGLLDRKSVV